MASFIYNLLQIGASHDNLQYDCISIDYFDEKEAMSNYLKYLNEKCWMPITYTTSSINMDPYDDISKIIANKAHDVIGQEFKKVVFIMDDNFKYSENGKLMARGSYYDAKGMLYQIVTRAIDNLKIVVFNNPELYKRLLEIKNMSHESN